LVIFICYIQYIYLNVLLFRTRK